MEAMGAEFKGQRIQVSCKATSLQAQFTAWAKAERPEATCHPGTMRPPEGAGTGEAGREHPDCGDRRPGPG